MSNAQIAVTDETRRWVCALTHEPSSMVGGLASEVSTIDVSALSAMVATIRRIAVGSRAQFIAMNRAIAAHRLKPIVDRVFPFTAAVEALRYYDAGKYFGKVVINHG